MIVRILAIIVTGAALGALWFGYGQLKILRGTAFWDYRYIVYAAGAFLGLSGLEWALSWFKRKIQGAPDDH
ncbi:MAG: hypothetical protein ACSHXB_17440 [Sulfitobacter sp.]